MAECQSPGSGRRFARTRLLGAVLLATAMAAGPAEADSPVLSAFGSTPTPTLATDGAVSALGTDGGKLYLAGSFTHVGRASGPFARFDSSGALDTATAAVGGGQDVSAVSSDGAGGWFVAGSFRSVGGAPVRNLAHLNADGTLDPGFRPALQGDPEPSPGLSAMTHQGHVLYVAGDFTAVGGQARPGIAALDDRTGQPTAWQPAVGGAPRAIAASDDTVYLVGSLVSGSGAPRPDVVALSAATGAERPGFEVSGSGPANAGSVAVVGDRIVIGDAGDPDTPYRDGITVLNAGTGALEDGFAPSCAAPGTVFAVTTSRVYAAFESPFDRCDAVGGAPNTGTLMAFSLATGQAITAFRPQLAAAPGGPPVDVEAAAADDDEVVVGGRFGAAGGAARQNMAALDPATGAALAPVYDPDGVVSTVGLAGSEVVAGGGFTAVAGAQRNGLAAIDLATGQLDPGFAPPATNGLPETLKLFGGAVYVGGSFTRVGGQARTGLAAFNAVTGALTPFAPAFQPAVGNVNVRVLLAGPDALYAGGTFASVDGVDSASLVRFDTDGRVDPGFVPAVGRGEVAALALAGSRLYVGGGFTTAGGAAAGNLAAVDATTGAAEPGFTASADNPVDSLLVDQGTLYLTGLFDHVSGAPREGLAAVDAGTGVTTAFDPRPTGDVALLGVARDEILIGGGAGATAEPLRSGLSSVTREGALTSLDPELLGSPSEAVIAPDGTLYAAGIVGVGSPYDGAAEGLVALPPQSAGAALPQNLAPPTITGTAAPGGLLSCHPGTWSGATTLDLSWLDNGERTVGTFDQAFRVPLDGGHTVRCVELARNAAGGASAHSSPVVSPGTPAVEQRNAGDATTSTLHVLGYVAPAGRTTLAHFRLVPLTGDAAATEADSGEITVPGDVDGQPIDAVVTGLLPGTTYDVLVDATSDAGAVETPIHRVGGTTLSPPGGPAAPPMPIGPPPSTGTTTPPAAPAPPPEMVAAPPDAAIPSGDAAAPGTAGPAGATGAATATPSAGAGTSASCVVPRLIGRTPAAARTALRAKHCAARVARRPTRRRADLGRVVAQTPRAGSRVVRGARVRLVVGRAAQPH